MKIQDMKQYNCFLINQLKVMFLVDEDSQREDWINQN